MNLLTTDFVSAPPRGRQQPTRSSATSPGRTASLRSLPPRPRAALAGDANPSGFGSPASRGAKWLRDGFEMLLLAGLLGLAFL